MWNIREQYPISLHICLSSISEDLFTVFPHVAMGHDRRPDLWGVCAAFYCLALATVSLRCYVRVVLIKSFWWDDAMSVAALVCPQNSSRSDRELQWLLLLTCV